MLPDSWLGRQVAGPDPEPDPPPPEVVCEPAAVVGAEVGEVTPPTEMVGAAEALVPGLVGGALEAPVVVEAPTHAVHAATVKARTPVPAAARRAPAGRRCFMNPLPSRSGRRSRISSVVHRKRLPGAPHGWPVCARPGPAH
jgi:hypothetical protein